MRTRAILSTLLLGSCLLACSALGADTDTQEADHTEGEPTYAQYEWLWADETEAEFKRVQGDGSPWAAPEFLPIDHPMAKRLQFWIDRMDEALRAAHPDAVKATPKPRVILRKDPVANAWVSYMPVAWRVPTRLARAADAGAPDPDDVGDASAPPDGGAPDDPGAGGAPVARAGARELTVGSNGQIGPAFTTPLERDHDERDLAEFLKFHNEGFAKCRLALEGGEVVIGEGCGADANLSASYSDRLAYNATGKWVTVTTGLFTSMLDEDRIVAVLAHELGHYYRSHSAQPTDVLNYFYALGDANHAYKPPPDPRYLEQTLAVRDKLRQRSWFTSFEEENRLMQDQRLGFYTTEQEADDIALEVLAKIGMPPTLAADSILQLQRTGEDEMGSFYPDTGEIKWAECSTLRERGFKDERGEPVSVPVGALSDPHHSYCFRVFNMTRELAAHAYKPSATRPRPPGEAWDKLLARLDEPAPSPPVIEGDGGADDGGGD